VLTTWLIFIPIVLRPSRAILIAAGAAVILLVFIAVR
jgi:hypothetical protein